MTVIDTSFLAALQDEDDRFHSQARQRPLWGDRFLIPYEIWVEYCQLLMRIGPPRERRAALKSLRQGVFEVQTVLGPDELARLAAESEPVQEHVGRLGHRPLTLYDLVVMRVAGRFKEPIYTFDQGMIAAVRDGFFPGARLG